MPVSAEVLRRLMAAGVTGDALVSIVEAIDRDMEAVSVAKPRSAGAIRQERYRARQAAQSVTSDVTGNVTECDAKEDPHTPKENYGKKTNSAHAREARIDPDWEPSSDDVEAVTRRGLPPDKLDVEVQAFREHHLGLGTLSDDFGSLFRGWVRHGQRSAKPGPARPRPSAVARGSPQPDDGPRVNTPSGPRSVAYLLGEHRAGRWSPLFGKPPDHPDCPIRAYLPALAAAS